MKKGSNVRKQSTMKVMIPLIALIICGIIVLMERNGVTSKYLTSQLEKETLEFTNEIRDEAKCLVLTWDNDEVGPIYEEMICVVLESMKIPYEIMEVTKDCDFSRLEKYETLVVTFQDWSILGKNLLSVCEWVKVGGKMMNMSTPLPNEGFLTIAGKLGIESGGRDYAGITGFQVHDNCMIGGEEGRIFPLMGEGEEPLVTSLRVGLSQNTQIFVSSEDGSIPLVWKCDYNEGTFVMINDTITDKYQRGFISLAYSLLEDVSIYPVINASAFYLDDFPSPVPEGDGEYIKKEYGVSVSSFYSTIWWPKVLQWGERYGIKYTGVIIELYSDDVKAPLERNYATTQFHTFGNMLLNQGGELGLHGYNHQPLCMKGIDDKRKYGDYKLWPSKEDAKAAVTELYEFSKELFPDADINVYVPPSNIISEAGIEALLEACPSIQVLASIYLPSTEGCEFMQEFEVDEKGIIHTPRLVSGLELDEYQKITALSELNFHYVQSHFMHPDDLLDEDRGAKKGFLALSNSFEEYLDWIYTSAPKLRNTTGSEMGTAVQQYDMLSVQREVKDDILTVKLGGFSGEAHFLMRINEGTLQNVDGCTCEHITGNLYAVHAMQDVLKIYLGEKN